MKALILALSCGLMMGAPVFIALQDTGCTPAQQSTVRTAVDVAADACKVAFGSTPEQLPPGVSLEDFCKRAEVVRTFTDAILGAKMGVSRNPGSYSDAGAK
jgi:hypothetical protein